MPRKGGYTVIAGGGHEDDMLRERIDNLLFENAFLSAFRNAGDASDTVADKVIESAQNSLKICHPDSGTNGTMRSIRGRLYDKFSKRLMQRLIENESEK